jgi:predicted Zn-dependent protease
LALWYLTPVSDWIVSVVLSTVPLSSDVELGKAAWRDMRKTHKLVRDEWGVKRVGQQLVQQAAVDDMEMEWSFGVVHANVVNAYCFPGGIVRVSDSLLRKLDLTQGELAALLGHEIGHVLHRHAQRRIIQQDLLSLVTQALLYDDEDVVDETFGQAVGELMLKSAKYLGTLSFSRKDEYQADATSWELLVASGLYQPHSLESLLAKLWSYDGSSGDSSWESTHPGTRDRIAALEAKWELMSPKEQRRLSRYPIH